MELPEDLKSYTAGRDEFRIFSPSELAVIAATVLIGYCLLNLAAQLLRWMFGQ